MKLVCSLAVLLLVPAVALAQPAGKRAARPASSKAAATGGTQTVSAIRAYLYYHSTGKFDERDLTGGGFALWNTIIGEGDATAPSEAAIVYVDVAVPGGTQAPAKLVVEATVGKQKIAGQSFEVSDWFTDDARSVALPMLITGVGCESVTITATLTPRGGKRSKKTASIEYSCGE